ncbi:hypothetical protein NIN12_004503 [Salmonella enterica]|nr:hypothetical protein [Salmonella enterica]
MTTITDKKQYPGEQYLNELITNIEFAARAPVEVVRAMAAELQKRREADSAEPVAYIFKHPAGKLFWALTDESNKGQNDVMPVYTAPPARDNKQTDELVMWVKRLAHSLRNARPNSKLHDAAMDYLSCKGLISVEDVLR